MKFLLIKHVDGVFVPNSNVCRVYALEQVKSQENLTNPRNPYFALVILMNCILIMFFEAKKFIRG